MDGARGSLAGFVSTSVLTSSDGLFGDNVEEKRKTEAPVPRPEDAAGYKPLYEQLKERQEQKDSDWKEKNNPFAPPKGLDEEEFEYIQDLESKREEVEKRRNLQHEEDLAQFKVARGAPMDAPAAALTAKILQKYPAKSNEKVVIKKKTPVVVVRAKAKPKEKKRKVEPKGDSERDQQKDKRPKVEKQAVKEESPVRKAKPSGAALGLVDYGSDSDTSE